MTTSGPATTGSGPPGTSPAHRSTSTSPRRPGTSPPRTPWAPTRRGLPRAARGHVHHPAARQRRHRRAAGPRPGQPCDCRTLSADDLPRALANNDTRGALKIVIDADTRKVLGVHAALDGADEVSLAATYAIKYGLTVEDLAETWAPYLTMAKALRLCARLFLSDLPTSCCA